MTADTDRTAAPAKGACTWGAVPGRRQQLPLLAIRHCRATTLAIRFTVPPHWPYGFTVPLRGHTACGSAARPHWVDRFVCLAMPSGTARAAPQLRRCPVIQVAIRHWPCQLSGHTSPSCHSSGHTVNTVPFHYSLAIRLTAVPSQWPYCRWQCHDQPIWQGVPIDS